MTSPRGSATLIPGNAGALREAGRDRTTKLESAAVEGRTGSNTRSVRFSDGISRSDDDTSLWDLLSSELDKVQEALNRARQQEQVLRTAAHVADHPTDRPTLPRVVARQTAADRTSRSSLPQNVFQLDRDSARDTLQPPPPVLPGTAVPSPTADAPAMTPLPMQSIDQEIAASQSQGPQCGTQSHKTNSSQVFELLPIWSKKKAKQSSTFSTTFSLANGPERGSSCGNNMLYEVGDDIVSKQNATDTWSRHFILHPSCTKRSMWEISSMILVTYDIIILPFGFFEPEKTLFFQVAEWVTRLFWSLDIPLSFASGFVTNDGTVELRPLPIAKRYLRSWFALDCLVVGVDWFELVGSAAGEKLGFARMGKASRIFRILRMLRLLRLAKINEIVSVLSERLPNEKLVIVIDIVKLITIMLGAAHLIGCVWYAIGSEGPADRNWLTEFGYDGALLEYRYIMSLRWALAQFAGGMDEVTPQSISEHVYAAAMYISCFWSGTVFLSILTSNMTQLYILGNQKSQQLNIMRRYLSQNGVSKNLALRVQRNAQHAMMMQARATPEAAVGLVELVSEPLRIELHFEMYFPLLGCHPFFAEYMKLCPQIVRKICHDAMSISATSVGDYIFHFGQSSNRMLIVKSGMVKYIWGSHRSKIVGQGAWLSEAPLWTRWVHRGSCQSVEDSIMFNLQVEHFHEIVGEFELTKFDPAEYAEIYLDNLNNTSTDEVTDLPLQENIDKSASRGRSNRQRGGLQDSHQLRRQWMQSLFISSQGLGDAVQTLDSNGANEDEDDEDDDEKVLAAASPRLSGVASPRKSEEETKSHMLQRVSFRTLN